MTTVSRATTELCNTAQRNIKDVGYKTCTLYRPTECYRHNTVASVDRSGA